MPTFIKAGLAAIVLAATLFATAARADVILTAGDAAILFTGPVENGFSIDNTGGTAIALGYYTGSDGSATWTVTATSGGAFTVSGINTYAIGSGNAAGRVDLELSGQVVGGGTVSGAIGSAGTQMLPAAFAGVELTALTIQSFGFTDGMFYVTSGFSDVTVTEVPEPATMLVLAGALCGFALVRRRQG